MSVLTPTATAFANTIEEKLDDDIIAQAEDIDAESVDGSNVNVSDASMSSSVAAYEEEDGQLLTNVLIRSYNPGFSDPYEGEFFELVKLSKDSILLAGLSVIYETSTGSEYAIYEFSEGHEMIGESLLFRLASSKEVMSKDDDTEVADVIYARNMSQSAGRIKLKYDDTMIDSVCWGIKETGCYSAFNSKKPTTLVREIDNEEIGDFVHVTNYKPIFDMNGPGLKYNEPEEELIEPKCRNVVFSELLTYYESTSTEQFIELYNSGEETTELDGCFVRYKSNSYLLSGKIVAHGFIVFYPAVDWRVTFTKNPVSSNKLEIIDVDGEVVDKLVYYSGQRRGLSLAMVGYKSDGSKRWEQTYNPTPGTENMYQQFKTCPVGKVINLETGNCVNESPIETTLAACPEGKYRNPLTGRCKSYATGANTELKPCAEGYERNPETNRCRRIATNTGADYPVTTGVYENKKEFASVWTITTIVVAGIGYIIFQYKDELKLKFSRR